MNCFHGIHAVTPGFPKRSKQEADKCETLASKTDINGFRIVGTSSTLNLYSQWEASYSKKQIERAQKWAKFIKDQNSFVSSKEMKQLVRKGAPNKIRGRLWMDLSGASRKFASNTGLYQKLLNAAAIAADPTSLSLIEVDLYRTFPNHPRFNAAAPDSDSQVSKTDEIQCKSTESSQDEPPLIQSLRRVLRAYSARNKLVGYCQGMNFIAGAMLLFLDEESAFWLLTTLLEDILPADYFAHDLIGCHVDLMALEELLPQAAPRVSLILGEVGLGIELLALEWMVGAFVRSLPSEAALRIWDCLFSEGGKVLFRAALALTRSAEPELAARVASCRSKERKEEAALAWMQGVGKGHVDADRVLKEAFALPLRRRDIEQARHRCRSRLSPLGSGLAAGGGKSEPPSA